MPPQPPQWTDFLSCCVCLKVFKEAGYLPVTLGCGHTMCESCLAKLPPQRRCPYDQSAIKCDTADLPINTALVLLRGLTVTPRMTLKAISCIGEENMSHFETINRCFEELVILLKPLAETVLGTGSGNGNVLSRPMQRKLVSLVYCQLVEEEGRLRCLRASRSLGERTVIELIVQHQNTQQLASSLWAAVRARGCQFLGPAMQEEVLRLILLALEDGSALSRKVLVLFVVQRLENRFPQTSKTAVGHVVQLLYRASCFRVTKRDDESSLMQLKEEFRSYENLRREHDAQIVQIAQEAGLRIAPEHWSQLLYGEQSHKSHMQSIIDKLQSPQSFTQSVNELILALQRTGDPANLTRFRPYFDLLCAIDPSCDKLPMWERLSELVSAVKVCVFGLVDFIHHHAVRKPDLLGGAHAIGKYKTSLCRDIIHRGTCPRGKACTFAHSEQEMERYRSRARRHSQRQMSLSGEQTPALNGNAGGSRPVLPLTSVNNGMPNMGQVSRDAFGQGLSPRHPSMNLFQPPAGAAAAGPPTSVQTSQPITAASMSNQRFMAPNGGMLSPAAVAFSSQSQRYPPTSNMPTSYFTNQQHMQMMSQQYAGYMAGTGQQQARPGSWDAPQHAAPYYGNIWSSQPQGEETGGAGDATTQLVLKQLRNRKEAVLAELEKNRNDPRLSQGYLHLQQSVADSVISSRAVNSLHTDKSGQILHQASSVLPHPNDGMGYTQQGPQYFNDDWSAGFSSHWGGPIEGHTSDTGQRSEMMQGGLNGYGACGRYPARNGDLSVPLWMEPSNSSHASSLPWRSMEDDDDEPLLSEVGRLGLNDFQPIPTTSIGMTSGLSNSFPDGLPTLCGGAVLAPHACFAEEGCSGLSTSLTALSESAFRQQMQREELEMDGLTTTGSASRLVERKPEKGREDEVAVFWSRGRHDEEVPFAAGPFVSKYGPISRKVKLVTGMQLTDILPETIVLTATDPIVDPVWEAPAPTTKCEEKKELEYELVELEAQIRVVERNVALRQELTALETLERELEPVNGSSDEESSLSLSSQEAGQEKPHALEKLRSLWLDGDKKTTADDASTTASITVPTDGSKRTRVATTKLSKSS